MDDAGVRKRLDAVLVLLAMNCLLLFGVALGSEIAAVALALLTGLVGLAVVGAGRG